MTEPTVPGANEPGRLTLFTSAAARMLISGKNIPLLKPGWHCRVCLGELLQIVNRMNGNLVPYVGCTRCDNPAEPTSLDLLGRPCDHTLVEHDQGITWHCSRPQNHQPPHRNGPKEW